VTDISDGLQVLAISGAWQVIFAECLDLIGQSR
jgi:hypothetical protein